MKSKNTNFIIFGQGRSGSDLLRSLLNSHPEVYCDVELFNPAMLKKDKPFSRFFINTFPLWYVQKMRKNYPDKYYGFKLFLWQLKKSEKVIKKLSDNGWKIIHIQRKNILKQAFSANIGMQTKKYNRTVDMPPPDESYHFEVNQIVGSVKFRLQQLQQEIKALEKIDHLTIIYEDDLKDSKNWNSTMARTFEYLHLEPVEVNSKLLVTDPRADSERIKNFGEIIDYLNNNGFKEVVNDYFKLL